MRKARRVLHHLSITTFHRTLFYLHCAFSKSRFLPVIVQVIISRGILLMKTQMEEVEDDLAAEEENKLINEVCARVVVL